MTWCISKTIYTVFIFFSWQNTSTTLYLYLLVISSSTSEMLWNKRTKVIYHHLKADNTNWSYGISCRYKKYRWTLLLWCWRRRIDVTSAAHTFLIEDWKVWRLEFQAQDWTRCESMLQLHTFSVSQHPNARFSYASVTDTPQMNLSIEWQDDIEEQKLLGRGHWFEALFFWTTIQHLLLPLTPTNHCQHSLLFNLV